ncbi:MAG TPA: thioesterase family protein [Rhodocyclaceae bacterium]|nr:thioesterase family protein [Rhodocyclaceae bacterium]
MHKLTVCVEIEVPFHDVDAMQVAWHGHYVKYFELARCALLRSFDYDYPQMQASGYLWPVVECELKYMRPARYGQRLLVEATLIEYENRLRIAYAIRCADSDEQLTKGKTTQLAIEAATMSLQFVSPPVVVANVEAACARLSV